MNLKRNFVLGVLGALLLSVPGCSTFQPSNQVIKINCTPSDVILRINGDKYNCPSEIEARRDRKITIEAYKDGYDRFSKQIDCHFSTSAKWDAVGTVVCFFPVFGFLSPGAWDLDETEVNVALYPISKSY